METRPIPYPVVRKRHPKELAKAIKLLRSGTSKHAGIPESQLVYNYTWGVSLPARRASASLHVKIGMWWTWIPIHPLPPEVRKDFNNMYKE